MKKQLLYLPLTLLLSYNCNAMEAQSEAQALEEVSQAADAHMIKTFKEHAERIQAFLDEDQEKVAEQSPHVQALKSLSKDMDKLLAAFDVAEANKAAEAAKESDYDSDSEKGLSGGSLTFYRVAKASDQVVEAAREGSIYFKQCLENNASFNALPACTALLNKKTNRLSALLAPLPAHGSVCSLYDYNTSAAKQRLKETIASINDQLDPLWESEKYEGIREDFEHPATIFKLSLKSVSRFF